MERRTLVTRVMLSALAAAAVGLGACESDKQTSSRSDGTRTTTTASGSSARAGSSEVRTESSPQANRGTPAQPRSRDGATRSGGDGAMRSGGDMTTTSIALPTGERGSSAVLVEKMLPRQVVVGEEFPYQIKVTNISDYTLTDVRVREYMHTETMGRSDMPAERMSEGRAMSGAATRPADRSDAKVEDRTSGASGPLKEPLTYPQHTNTPREDRARSAGEPRSAMQDRPIRRDDSAMDQPASGRRQSDQPGDRTEGGAAISTNR